MRWRREAKSQKYEKSHYQKSISQSLTWCLLTRSLARTEINKEEVKDSFFDLHKKEVF